MITYYCIVFLDRRQEVLDGIVERHRMHGDICCRGHDFWHVYTNKDEAVAEFEKNWKPNQYWTNCYEIWEFEV